MRHGLQRSCASVWRCRQVNFGVAFVPQQQVSRLRKRESAERTGQSRYDHLPLSSGVDSGEIWQVLADALSRVELVGADYGRSSVRDSA
jgi:hypothetical protein